MNYNELESIDNDPKSTSDTLTHDLNWSVWEKELFDTREKLMQSGDISTQPTLSVANDMQSRFEGGERTQRLYDLLAYIAIPY